MFRYPFFSQPPRLVDAEHLLVNEAGMKRVNEFKQRTPSRNRNVKRARPSLALAMVSSSTQEMPANCVQGFPPEVCGAAYVKSELRPSAGRA